MSDIVISVENLSKVYRLGQIGTGTLTNDLKVWWARLRGKPNPLLKIGQEDPYHKAKNKNVDNSKVGLDSRPSTLDSSRPLASDLCSLPSDSSPLDSGPSSDYVWALKDVSFEVKRGEVLGIIGRNGAGKSTLLKIISRITAPTLGRIKIKGRVASLLEVGTGFHPELTGRENIYLNGAILGMTKEEVRRKFDEIVDFSGVEQFIDTPVKRYSSGMYVRLAFAVAAHLEPEILLVDEVLAVGDAAFQQKCLGKMGQVAKEGRTVLFVSHNMAAIASITQSSICMDQGEILFIGSTSETIEKYLKQTIGNSISDSKGFLDLTKLKRPSSIINPDAQFEWISLIDKDGNQRGIFIEGEPIFIKVGFRIDRPTRDLQFGFGIRSIDLGVELFVTPSKIYQGEYKTGKYTICMSLAPNYLRSGKYSTVLKMFADGRRQETFGETVMFSIEKTRNDDESLGYERWRSGPIKFDFPWEDIKKS